MKLDRPLRLPSCRQLGGTMRHRVATAAASSDPGAATYEAELSLANRAPRHEICCQQGMVETHAGELLGSYRLVERLGAGGMGEVWRAEHVKIRIQVAIKLVLAERDDRVAEARFLREANATAKVRHPGIVAVSDYGTRTGGGAYLVMELLDGESLAARLGRGSLAPSAAIELGAQIAKALAAAHDAGVIHRDLKPANVFLVKDAAVRGGVRAKVVDFGIASEFGSATDDTGLTASGALIGTPLYMAPEQVVSRHGPIDHRADLYALGVVLFEMVTGVTPFRGPTLGDLIDQHANVQPSSPQILAPSTPARLDALILRLLAKSRHDRPATAHDVARTLGELDARGDSAELAATLPPDRPLRPSGSSSALLVTQPTLTSASAVEARPEIVSPHRTRRWVPLVGLAAFVGTASIAVALRAHYAEGSTEIRADVSADAAGALSLAQLADPELEAACHAAARRTAAPAEARACLLVRDREVRRDHPDLTKVFGVMSIACDRGEDAGCRSVAEMLSTGAGVSIDLAKSRQLAEASCAAGGASSCELAGEIVLADSERAPDPKLAHADFVRSCELGSAAGCARAMWTWRYGVGTAPDPERASAIEKRAWMLAEAGCAADDPHACRSLGGLRILSTNPDRARAVVDLQRACDLGHPAACTEVGVSYLNGLGVSKDAVRSAAALQRGCDLGDGNGCQYFGFFLALGVLGNSDVAGGFAMAKRVCDEQGARYCFALAGLYASGVGAPADPTLSASLYERACAGGELDACAMTIPRQPPTDGRDETVAIRRMDGMCAAGGAGGCVLAGDLARRHADPTKAVAMYERACELSVHTVGCDDLANLYFAGLGTQPDAARGRALLLEACAAGTSASCYSLAKRFRDGEDMARDPAEALRLLDNACSGGIGMACLDAATLLSSKSSGLTRDAERAKKMRARGCEIEPTRCTKTR